MLLVATHYSCPVLVHAPPLHAPSSSCRAQLPAIQEVQHRAAVFVVFRNHIPNGVLSCGVFPILVSQNTTAVLMLPYEHWPTPLTIRWRDRRL